MDHTKHHPTASSEYNSANAKAISAIKEMTQAIKDMAAEHAFFHAHSADLNKRLEAMKKDYGGELDNEVVRSTALDQYLSEGNRPKVVALGHFEMEKVLGAYEEADKELKGLQRETARRVEGLVGEYGGEGGEGGSVEGEKC